MVTGNILAIDEHELISPITKKPCVYYKLEVKKEMKKTTLIAGGTGGARVTYS